MSVSNVRCPLCVENGHDNGADSGHMFLMEQRNQWCCNRTEHHPDGMMYFLPNDPETNTPIYEEGREGVSEAHHDTFEDKGSITFGSDQSSNRGHSEFSQRTLIDYRGVPAEAWGHYGVEFQTDGVDVVKQFYPITKNLKRKAEKVRVVEDKEFFWEGKVKNPDMFGMETIGEKIPKRVLITEGEVDAVSAYHMLKKYKVKCISTTAGDSIKDITNAAEFLDKVPELAIAPDNDVPGNEFCEKVVSLFPDIKVVMYSEKDANLMLTKGKEKEFVDAYFRADRYRPPSIVSVGDLKESLREFVPKGISYPWSSLDAITYGVVPHQVISVGAGPGAGKSTVIRGIQEYLMFHHGLPIGIFSLEESKELTLRNLVGWRMNQRIHLPGSTYNVEQAVHEAEQLEGKAYIYDRRFFNGRWEKIEKSIRFMVANGVHHFFIDPITALVVHLDASQQNTALGKIMSDLSALMQELPIYVMLVNHLNNPTSGKTHDEGGMVLPSQFTGSKAQWRFSTDMWGFERNILSEDDDEKNTLIVRNLKHRTDGSLTGRSIKLHFNNETGRLEENTSGFRSVDPTITMSEPQPEPEKKPRAEVKKTTSMEDILGG